MNFRLQISDWRVPRGVQTTFIAYAFLITCSTAVHAVNPSSIHTYADVIHLSTKLSGPQSVIGGLLFGLGAVGFGYATKYCWKKTKETYNRSRVEILEYHPNGMPKIMRGSSLSNVPCLCWAGVTCFCAYQAGLWSLPALACAMRTFRLLVGNV